MVYSIEFSKALLESGRYAASSLSDCADAQRAALYLALLSSELTLKALLERAGMTLGQIRPLSHRMTDLLKAIDKCTVDVQVNAMKTRRVQASRVRSISIQYGSAQSTVGRLLSLEFEGASVYPNQVRYGERLVHAPASAMLMVASVLLNWAEGDGATISVAES